MKKYLFITFSILTCCGIQEDTDGLFLSYVNMETSNQTKWSLNSYENEISIDYYNAIEIEGLNLIDFPRVESEEEKDYLFSLFTYTEWMIDSIIDDESITENRQQWFWLTKKTIMQNSELYSLGNVKFCNEFKSYLFVKKRYEQCYGVIQLYAVNVKNEIVVSVVQLNNLFTSYCGDYGDYKTEVSYQPRKRKCVLQLTRGNLLSGEINTRTENTSFRFSSEGKIIWENNNN